MSDNQSVDKEFKSQREHLEEFYSEIEPILLKKFQFNRNEVSKMVVTMDWSSGGLLTMDLTQFPEEE